MNDRYMRPLEHVSKLKYLGVSDESEIIGAERHRKEASGRKYAGAVRSLMNTISILG